MLGPEPTLIIQAVIAMLVAANTALTTTTVLPLPPWVSTAISIVLIGLGAVVNRSQVTPAKKAAAALVDAQGPSPEELVVPEQLDSEQWLTNRQATVPESEPTK